jgi:hypothetical protein
MRRSAVLLVLLAAAAVATTPAQSATTWNCKRVISSADWQRVLGTSIKVQYGESAIDCLWFHRRLGSHPAGGISGYPAVYKIWHRIYVDDATGSKRYGECEEADTTRTRLTSFHGDFAWSTELRQYAVASAAYDCPGTKTLKAITRSVYVVHHHRLFKIDTSTAYGQRPGAHEPAMLQLVKLAHIGTRRF